MSKADEALDLAQRAVAYLYESDPEFVQGGCSDVAEIIEALLQRRGYRAERVYGFAKRGTKGEPFEHAWLKIEGGEVDPVLWVQGRKPEKYRYTEDASVQEMLACPSDLTSYIDELDGVL